TALARIMVADLAGMLQGARVAIPDNVRDGLGNAFGTGFAAAAGAFPGRAAPCITETAYPQLQSTPTVLRCLTAAAGGALSEGGAAAELGRASRSVSDVSASGTVARATTLVRSLLTDVMNALRGTPVAIPENLRLEPGH